MLNFNHQSCSRAGCTILNFESHFCELSLHQLEKRELVFSFDLETVIPIVQKKRWKIKIQIWWIHVVNSLYTNYSIAQNRKKHNHPLHNLKTHKLNFKKQWVELRILFAWQFWNIFCNCHVLSTYICILQDPQSYVY